MKRKANSYVYRAVVTQEGSLASGTRRGETRCGSTYVLLRDTRDKTFIISLKLDNTKTYKKIKYLGEKNQQKKPTD